MSFQSRLRVCMARGNLTVADLARWFGRPHATVTTWTKGRVPGGTISDCIFLAERLRDLETRIMNQDGFPVPSLGQRERIAYLEKLNDPQ